VRVFLDECIDWRLERDIVGQDCSADGLDDNPERSIADLASQHFDVFVTLDRNLSFQQNLDSFPIAVLVLGAKTSRLTDLKPLIPNLLLATESAQAGAAKFIGAD
jgi:hypothetical protein